RDWSSDVCSSDLVMFRSWSTLPWSRPSTKTFLVMRMAPFVAARRIPHLIHFDTTPRLETTHRFDISVPRCLAASVQPAARGHRRGHPAGTRVVSTGVEIVLGSCSYMLAGC